MVICSDDYPKVLFIQQSPNETTMVAFHRDRIVKVTINYYDGSMNPEAKKQISKLLGTLAFNK
ncbi:hypothetical protein [Candidatus Symbiopectobacterium sp.]|uniref:hypothetical protein n=1 Tax=Candidatus Symbiopectobacterium sp. TaxID=2816440 RepID=UPI0025B8E574|nr:hypothetical protein [Candidatus Symbiopectobacterium sp.]